MLIKQNIKINRTVRCGCYFAVLLRIKDMRRIYIQMDEKKLNRDELEILEEFHQEMISCGVEVIRREHFRRDEILELSIKTVEDVDKDGFVVAFCVEQEDAEEFSLRNIPVIAYEPDAFKNQATPPKSRFVVLSLEGVDCHYIKKVWCRYFKRPWKILETDRTILREICMEDMEDLFSMYEDPQITRFMEPLFEREEEIQYQRDYIDKVYGFYEYGMWLVIEESSGAVIGRAGVESKSPEDPNRVELGYMIRRDRQGQGYASEVCEAIVEYAKEELMMESVCARIHPENKASVRIAEKLGMKPISKTANENGEITYEIVF